MTSFQTQLTKALRPARLALHQQWQASVFPRFFAWWGEQLAGCLPPGLRGWLARNDEAPLVCWRQDCLWRHGEAGWVPCVSGTPADNTCVLLLEPRQALVRTLTFPPAAAPNLADAIGYEMDRHTPFRADQVYYGFKRLPGKPREPATVVLGVAQRERLDALLDTLAGQGVRPQAIDVAAPSGNAGMGLNLLPLERRPPGQHRTRQLNAVLGLLILCLSVVALQLWLYNRGAALAAMQDEVARLRNEASTVQQLRQQLQNGQGATRYLAERRQGTPLISQVLSELTHCLPADTWLSQFSLEPDGQLTLGGQSPHAGNLIAELKGCPSVTGAQFQGVIQPDETTGGERFYLLAHLRKEEHPDAPTSVTP